MDKFTYEDKPNIATFYDVAVIERADMPAFRVKTNNIHEGDGPCSCYLVGLWNTRKTNGFAAPPEVGTKVKVSFNGLGIGTVVGFFIEVGFIGVQVKPDNRPEWHIKQSICDGVDKHPDYLVFGAEIERVEP